MPVITQTPKTSHTYLNKSKVQIKQFREECSFTDREGIICVLQITREKCLNDFQLAFIPDKCDQQ